MFHFNSFFISLFFLIITDYDAELIGKPKNGFNIICFNRCNRILKRSMNNRKKILTNIYGEEGEEVTIEEFDNLSAPSIRRLFSSEEDLEDMPPNFSYSTARLTKDFNSRYSILWGDNKNIETAKVLNVTSPTFLKYDSMPIDELHDLIDKKHENNILLNKDKNIQEPSNTNVEEYEEEWVYEDVNSSEHVDDDEYLETEEMSNLLTTPTSSVEALIDRIEGVRQKDQNNDIIVR
uniref:Erythrocyte membrane antigen 1 n=1 Tax=Meloidogyne hapla TaxID=6305 RepID=A0A1I8BPA6_MELHA